MKNDIIENYSVGDKLPSVRKISSTYNISKTTIESAYGQLVAEDISKVIQIVVFVLKI